MNFILRDLWYGWGLISRTPGITLIILILLALGTGGVATVFNPVYSLVLAKLPFPEPDRLVLIGGNITLFDTRYNDFEKNDVLDWIFLNKSAFALSTSNIYIPEKGINKEILAVDVTEKFFETVGSLPQYGYSFAQKEGGNTVIISNKFWRNEMMRTEDTIGKIIQMQNRQYTIIGIMPDSFDFPVGTDVWFFNGRAGGTFVNSTRQYLGRLQPKISISQAVRELKTINLDNSTYGLGNDGPVLQLLQTYFYGDRLHLFLMLSATSVLFLVLVSSSVMSILVTRSIGRKPEMVLRITLGATRWNLLFQLLRETLPLAIVGTIAGLWFSEIANMWMRAQFPTLKGGETVVSVKIVFSAIMIFFVTIISGLVPALYASGVDLNTGLKPVSLAKRRFFSIQEMLSGVQLSLALALLISAGFLLRSIMINVDYPVGWTSRSISVVRAVPAIETSSNADGSIIKRVSFLQEFQYFIETIPEVASIGIMMPIPFSEKAVHDIQQPLSIFRTREATQKRPQNSTESASHSIQGFASSNAFEMLEIPLVAGRYFTQYDVDNEFIIRRDIAERKRPLTRGVGGVVIINQTLAKQFWPGESAVGKIIYDNAANEHEIVGVVRDFYMDTNSKKIIPAMYSPAQHFASLPRLFLVKLHSYKLINDLRQRISIFEKQADIDVQLLSNYVSKSTVNIRLATHLLGCFAILGIVVSGLGVYATTMLMATSRIREIGIRLAVGAKFRDILLFALWRGMRAIAIGLPFGLLMAWILSRILSSFIFQLNANYFTICIICCTILIGIVTIAALIPALKSTRVNTIDALRKE